MNTDLASIQIRHADANLRPEINSQLSKSQDYNQHLHPEILTQNEPRPRCNEILKPNFILFHVLFWWF